MIKSFVILFIMFFCCSCSQHFLFTSFHEPANEGLRMLQSNDGKHWQEMDTLLLKPSVGIQKVLRDPSMVQGPDGVFHLVWTTSWKGDPGFGYASTKDLLHWSNPIHIPVMAYEPSTVNVWAPELFYDDEVDRYIIVWASCIPGRFVNGMEADSNNHRLYYAETKDFKTFTQAKLFFDPGYSVIDATIVKKAKGDYILVFKDNTRPERNIKVARGRSPLGPWTNISTPLTAKYTEGPSVVKLRNKWLIYFDSYETKTYEAISTNDFIDFKKADYIKVPLGHKHGTIVPLRKNNWKILMKLFKK